MAGIKMLSIYKNKICGQCGYTWDFPIVREDLLTPIQRLYYFEINECQTCYCIGIDITEVGEFELKIQKEKGYKEIMETRNIPFSFVSRKEAYEYALYAYICKKRGDAFSYAKSYVMGAHIEKEQREKYLQSLSYDHQKDVELIENSKLTEVFYLKNAEVALKDIIVQNLVPDKFVDAELLLAYVYLLLDKDADAMELLNKVAKQKLSKEEIKTVKELVGIKKC